jgi:hypothetical protein
MPTSFKYSFLLSYFKKKSENQINRNHQKNFSYSHFGFLFVYYIPQGHEHSKHINYGNKYGEKEREAGFQVVIVVAITGQLHDLDQLCIVID